MADIERSFIFLTGNGIADPGQTDRLAALETRLKKPGAKLLLHLHGGLVDEPAGVEGATRLSGRTADSWNCDDDWVQVYVVWRTGIVEQARRNWPDLVRDDRLYQVILTKLIRFIARKIGIPAHSGARSIDAQLSLDEASVRRRILGLGTADERRNPFADIEPHFGSDVAEGARSSVLSPQSDTAMATEFQGELRDDPAYSTAVRDLNAAVNEGLPGRAGAIGGDPETGYAMYRKLSDAIKEEIGPVETEEHRTARGPVAVSLLILEHAGRVAFRCFKRFRNQRDHGFHATIVEELCRELYADLIGAKFWGMMTRDAAEHFEGEGFGSALLATLRNVPAPERFVISGHSAGSIWASHMLLAMKEAGMDQRAKLLLLAPAVRQDLFARVIDGAGELIESCTMFTMSDDLERADAVLGQDKGYIYPSSLLYCVSGMFEERDATGYVDAPLLGMRRFADAGWMSNEERVDAKTIAQFFDSDENQIILAPAAGICEANCHGCFDDEPMTLASAAAYFSR